MHNYYVILYPLTQQFLQIVSNLITFADNITYVVK